MEKEDKKQNIIFVVLALIHVFITAFGFYYVDKITAFAVSLDQQLPMRYYLIHVATLTPIITAIIGGGYVFKHRKKLTKKDVIQKWIEFLPWMCAISVISLVWAIHDPVY